jgi:hypothetical protein
MLAIVLLYYGQIQERLFPGFSSSHINDLASKLGDALLIAWFISLMVDIGEKKGLIGEFLFESSAHIIGRQLPEQIREEVREYLNAPFVRPLWKVTYELLELPNSNAVKLKSTYWGFIENLTTKRRGFPFNIALDPSWLTNVPQPKLSRVELKRNGKNILKTQVINDLSFREIVKVRPGLPGRCESLLECIEYFPDSYEYSFINEATVQHTELTIYWDKEEFDVEVNLSSGADGKVAATHFDTHSTWSIHKPLLPGQCVLTKWKRKIQSKSVFLAKPQVEPTN